MTDIVDSETRSRMMAGIQGKNTKPEIIIRSLLHKNGFRFRIHVTAPVQTDIVLRKYNAIIFVHGCFWHRHDCRYFKWPQTRTEFWKNKLNRNVENDKKHIRQLKELNWRICIIWECAVRDSGSDRNRVALNIMDWLRSDNEYLEVRA
jgi:DNA mismatch endonuclease (patch repair protein)